MRRSTAAGTIYCTPVGSNSHAVAGVTSGALVARNSWLFSNDVLGPLQPSSNRWIPERLHGVEHNYNVVSVPIPPFTPDGLLPPGVHSATWEEFSERFGSTHRRKELLLGLQEALTCLARAGCSRVYIDGSFVTAKLYPGDFDACWDIAGVDISSLDLTLMTFENRRAAQKLKFGGELFPSHINAGMGSTFLEFFQVDKHTGNPKGIVVLDLKRWRL